MPRTSLPGRQWRSWLGPAKHVSVLARQNMRGLDAITVLDDFTSLPPDAAFRRNTRCTEDLTACGLGPFGDDGECPEIASARRFGSMSRLLRKRRKAIEVLSSHVRA